MSVTITVVKLRSAETKEAICIINPDNMLKRIWLPKSEIRDDKPSTIKKGHWDVTIPDWLAAKHNLG